MFAEVLRQGVCLDPEIAADAELDQVLRCECIGLQGEVGQVVLGRGRRPQVGNAFEQPPVVRGMQVVTIRGLPQIVEPELGADDRIMNGSGRLIPAACERDSRLGFP